MVLPSKLINQFLDPKIQSKVAATHDDIRNQPFKKKAKEMSVLDFLADPNTGFSHVKFHEKILASLQAESATQWTDFEFRGGPDITIMKTRHEFVQHLAPSDIDLLKDPAADPKEISRLTFYARVPSTLLAFKYWYLVKNHEYSGVHATTAPVLAALKGYWKNPGTFGKTLRAQSNFQHSLASELNLSPNILNTTLWVLGGKFIQQSKQARETKRL